MARVPRRIRSVPRCGAGGRSCWAGRGVGGLGCGAAEIGSGGQGRRVHEDLAQVDEDPAVGRAARGRRQPPAGHPPTGGGQGRRAAAFRPTPGRGLPAACGPAPPGRPGGAGPTSGSPRARPRPARRAGPRPRRCAATGRCVRGTTWATHGRPTQESTGRRRRRGPRHRPPRLQWRRAGPSGPRGRGIAAMVARGARFGGRSRPPDGRGRVRASAGASCGRCPRMEGLHGFGLGHIACPALRRTEARKGPEATPGVLGSDDRERPQPPGAGAATPPRRTQPVRRAYGV